MKIRSIAAPIVATGALVSLAACSTPGEDTPFADPATATWPQGTFAERDRLAMVQPGVTKNQMYALLGPPHFDEGFFHVRVWHYLLHFRDADKVVTCEYQVQFDADNRVVRTRWQTEECRGLGAGDGA